MKGKGNSFSSSISLLPLLVMWETGGTAGTSVSSEQMAGKEWNVLRVSDLSFHQPEETPDEAATG